MQEDQEERPIVDSFLLIPFDALTAHTHDDAVHQAVVRAQEREHEVADHYPAQKVGQEHSGLGHLGHLLAVQVGNHDGQRYRQHHAQHDEHDVVADGVAEHVEGGFLVVGKQELEVFKAAPGAVVEQAVQEPFAGGHLVFFERDDQPEHRQVAKQEIPYQRGQRQEEQLQIVQRKLCFLFDRFSVARDHFISFQMGSPLPQKDERQIKTSIPNISFTCILYYTEP